MLWILAGVVALVGGVTWMAATLPPWVVLIVLCVLAALYWRLTAPLQPQPAALPPTQAARPGPMPTAEICNPAPKPAPPPRAGGASAKTFAVPRSPVARKHKRSWKDDQEARIRHHKNIRATALNRDELPLTPQQADQLSNARTSLRKSLAKKLRPDPYMLNRTSDERSGAKPFSTQYVNDDALLSHRTHRRSTTGDLADRLTQSQ